MSRASLCDCSNLRIIEADSEAVKNPSGYELGEMFSNAGPELRQRAHDLLIRFDELRETSDIASLVGDEGLDLLQEMAVRVALFAYDHLGDLRATPAKELVEKLENYMEVHWSEDLPMAA